jgi:hypothetical protein
MAGPETKKLALKLMLQNMEYWDVLDPEKRLTMLESQIALLRSTNEAEQELRRLLKLARAKDKAANTALIIGVVMLDLSVSRNRRICLSLSLNSIPIRSATRFHHTPVICYLSI